jgi:hypothetical protein
MTQVKIKENSFLAKLAARKLRAPKVAMVIGRTIHLHNSSKEEFLNNQRWVRHEVAHIKQYKKFGFVRFIILYLLETFNKGYEYNRFEVEARRRERDVAILSGIQFI